MDREAVAKVLERAEPFDILEPAQRDALIGVAKVETWPLHQYVFRQGQPSPGRLFVVAEGLVEITVAAESGVESVVGCAGRATFSGKPWCCRNSAIRPRPGSAGRSPPCASSAGTWSGSFMPTSPWPVFSAPCSPSGCACSLPTCPDLSTSRAGEAYTCVAEPLFRRRVGDLMSSPVVTCGIDDPVTDAARTMSRQNFGALVVIERDGRACGMLSARHLVRHLVADRRYPVDECRVGQVCSRPLAW
jgi:CBS domain-containing protein